jgi:tRNA-dihydrouridine synthase A
MHWNKPKIYIAPMAGYTDCYFRYLIRLLSRHVILYTEMTTTSSLLYSQHPEKYLSFHPVEHPIGLQLGGSDPSALAKCVQLASSYGYDEINLNVGCPSSRVQAGHFGACLMAKPDLVAQCLQAMQNATDIPITIKTRLGLGAVVDYPWLMAFTQKIADTGCKTIILHARLADLGKTTRQNRSIDVLQYDVVYQLKSDFPDLEIIVNGGIRSIADIKHHLQYVDGVMIGRAAVANTYFLSEIDRIFFNDTHPIPTREEITNQYLAYTDKTQHLMGLYKGIPGAKTIRRRLLVPTQGR